MEIIDGAVSKCSYELYVKVVNKSNIRTKISSVVTHTHDNIIL
jgi:hypothetical protein